MKRFLLSLFTLVSILTVNAQQRDLWFNELVPWPASGTQEEYIELYNTSISEIPLDCYVIVSVNSNGAYVYNFPQNAKLSGLSYYLISSSYDVDFKAKDKEGKTRYTFTSTDPHASNWNDIGTGGSILFYSYNSNTKKWGTGTSVSKNFNDFIDDKQVSLLLYKINSDGTTSLVNGFFSKGIPASVTSLPQLDIAPGSCATQLTVPLIFNNGKITEQSTEVGPASGNQQGYSKIGNGICGNWVKTQNELEFTPAKPNPSSIGTTAAGKLTTSQKLVCGNRIDFTISAPLTSSVYPVKVLLFIDNNKDGVLDGTDTHVATYPTSISSGTSTVYSFTSLPTISADQQFLVVYQTFQGCYDQAKVPDVTTGALTTTQKNICGNQVNYTITGTGDALTYSLPIEVAIYPGVNGQLAADTAGTKIDAREVTSFTNGSISGSFDLAQKNEDVIVVYKASNCYTISPNPVKAPLPSGGITTTQTYSCGQKVDFTINATGDAITYSTPITVNLYFDEDGDGQLDADLTGKLLGSAQVLSFTNGTASGSIALSPADQDKKVVVQYMTSVSCITTPSIAPTITPCPPIANNDYFPPNLHPLNTIDANLYGGNTKWTSELLATSTKYETKSSNLSPAVESGLDSDPRNPSLSNIKFELIAGSYKEEKSCTGGGSVIFQFNENGTFSIDRSNSLCVFQVTFQYKIVNTLTNEVSNTATVTVEFSENASPNPLPVTYKSFTASRNGNKVALVWETAMEENNRGFHVQRNVDGTWKDIAFVFTQADGGNSNAILRYSYNDVNNSKGITQYRILQVDKDGTGKYSEIRAVRGEAQASKVMVFPNPSHTGSVNVLFDDATSVRDVIVSDVAGRVVKHYKAVSSNSLVIENLVNGYYTVQIINHTTAATAVEKVIIKKR